ncbi:TonB-dependent receptor [Pedobacter hiemivivus]|uniref:TonB-dependent receptor n=1 Tax=Pedobacter hiemivivus TaxID=2530454 RepID=A0A4R0MAL2_9SPHI|nr:TonB-dependent receptor [Pedobacter hiemivivus]TCC82822.1 TonB-dependent receptor [Pedobacter hiemivivus]
MDFKLPWQKIMRITILAYIILISASSFLQATPVNAQALDKRISVNYKNTSAFTVITELQQKTNTDFGFTKDLNLDKIYVEKLQLNNEEIREVLKTLFKGQQIGFKEKAGAIILFKLQQPGRISGKVVDERGESLPGASIRIIQTNQSVQGNVDGNYNFTVVPGTYTIEVSYVSFQTKRITDVVVKAGQLTNLSIVLKAAANQLDQVVVTSSFKKESIAGLYAQQKNEAGLSDGISAEQIGRTPDRHVGESLARITGVSTTEGKRVVVRGIAERYNVATLNGSTLPSTDVQERNFEFDLIPTNLVDNIAVSKSITPDMPYSFAGGLVKITTKAIPTENFMSLNAGIGFNSRTVGKDFLSYGRGKHDYLGFDDGGRDHFPEGIVSVDDAFNPRVPDDQNKVKAAQVAEQNKRIGGTERLGTRAFGAAPSQNYQLSFGQVYSLSSKSIRKLGFVGSLSYRNTQRNNYIANMRRGGWSIRPTNADDPEDVNTGNRFSFNTSLGALLNGGFNTEKHSIETYNLYTRIFDNQFNRISGWTWNDPKSTSNNPYPYMEEDERPKFTDLLQNKIGGKHHFGQFTIDWSLARTSLNQVEQDAVSAKLNTTAFDNLPDLQYYNYPGQSSDPDWGGLHRGRFAYDELDQEAVFNTAFDFRIAKTSHKLKTGYNYFYRHVNYDWLVLPIVLSPNGNALVNYREIPIQQWGNHMGMEDPITSLFYRPGKFSDSNFEGESATHGSYLMLDNKLGNKVRLVWGARAEYFKLDTLKNPASLMADQNVELLLEGDKNWRFLPSANATYSPWAPLNIRFAYGKSAVRPGLMENSRFSRYSPEYGSRVRSQGVTSTIIDNYDAKIEWFPKAGEIISIGYFYKYFDKPAEYFRLDNESGSGSSYITIGNSEWAKVYGWEFEMRKSLGFVRPETAFLQNIYLNGNLTLQRSTVQAREIVYSTDEEGNQVTAFSYMKYPRQLYGQVPLLLNLGLQYAGDRLGLNVSYNYMDYKTFITSSRPDLAEYERPRGQLDAQVSYRFPKKNMEVRLNMGNLTDAPHRFFINDGNTYVQKEGTAGLLDLEWADRYEYKPGFSEKFEKGYTDAETGQLIGDRESFTRYVGRTFSLSFAYKF